MDLEKDVTNTEITLDAPEQDFSKQHINRSDQRPESFNGPEYDQLGTHMIPQVMEPKILDISHGLNMPDGPTAIYSRTSMNEVAAVNPGGFYDSASAVPFDADSTQYKDANPTDEAKPTRK